MARKVKDEAKKAPPGLWGPVIADLAELVETAKAGGMAAVEQKFTVRTVRRGSGFDKPTLSAADVAAVRDLVGASQPVFAALLGVSANTVRAWEQGVNAPSGMAARFLAEIRRDPAYWKARVHEAATAAEPAPRGGR